MKHIYLITIIGLIGLTGVGFARDLNLQTNTQQSANVSKVNIIDKLKPKQMPKEYKPENTDLSNKKAINFSAETIDGKKISLTDYEGKIILIDFFAAWCGPCRDDMPKIVNLYDKYKDKGLIILGISLDKDNEKALNFIKTNNIRHPVIFDGKAWNNEIVKSYKVTGIPCKVLIDSKGIINTVATGSGIKRIEKIIKKLIK